MKLQNMYKVLALLMITAMLLGACVAPTPQVVEKVVTQVVEKEKIVEKPVEVEKVVTQIVEKPVEKIVEVTAVPPKMIKVTSTNGPDENSGTQIARHKLLLAGFKELRPDVEIIANPGPFDATTFPARLAAGTMEDTYLVAFTEPQKMIANKYAADITDIVSKWDGFKSFNPGVLSIVQDQAGRVYGLPVNGYALGLLYNRELLKQAGLNPDQPPLTWTELREAAKTVKEKTGQFGFMLLTDTEGGWLFTGMAYSFGVDMITREGDKWVATYNNDAAVRLLTMLRDMYHTDKTIKVVTGGVDAAKALTNGEVAMHVKAPDLLFWMKDNLQAKVEDFGEGPLPQAGGNATLTGGAAWLFNPKSPPEVLQAAVEWSIYRDFNLDTYELDLKTKRERGELIGIPSLPLFTGDYQAKRDAILAKYVNVPLENFAPYVNATNLKAKAEPPVEAQKLYAELANVLQKIVADPTADPKAILDASAKTFQAQVLDNVK